MDFTPIRFTAKDGRECRIRPAALSDAEELLRYFQITSTETRNLKLEPEETRRYTLEMEREFLQTKYLNSDTAAFLIAERDGKHLGNCSFFMTDTALRYRHRASVGIALYREYWGLGIGKALLTHAIRLAGQAGFEQLELQVRSDNARAIALYESLGFVRYGLHERALKFSDGTYASQILMLKPL